MSPIDFSSLVILRLILRAADGLFNFNSILAFSKLKNGTTVIQELDKNYLSIHLIPTVKSLIRDANMKLDDKQFRPLLIKVLNKLLPYTQAGWKYIEGDLPYEYEWGDESNWSQIGKQIKNEIDILTVLSAEGVISIVKKPDPTIELPEIRKHLSSETPVMVMSGENDKFKPYWLINIRSVDNDKLTSLLGRLELERTALEVIERPAMAHHLGGKIDRITKDFWIHDDKWVSIRGRRIVQKPENDRIAIKILKNYKNGGAYTPLDMINADHARANKLMNEIRSAFKSATGEDYNHFTSEHNIGYRFKP